MYQTHNPQTETQRLEAYEINNTASLKPKALINRINENL